MYHKRNPVVIPVPSECPKFHWLTFGYLTNSPMLLKYTGFPGGSAVKNPPANAGDPGSIPVPGRSPGEGNGNPLQYSCLENSIDRGAS